MSPSPSDATALPRLVRRPAASGEDEVVVSRITLGNSRTISRRGFWLSPYGQVLDYNLWPVNPPDADHTRRVFKDPPRCHDHSSAGLSDAPSYMNFPPTYARKHVEHSHPSSSLVPQTHSSASRMCPRSQALFSLFSVRRLNNEYYLYYPSPRSSSLHCLSSLITSPLTFTISKWSRSTMFCLRCMLQDMNASSHTHHTWRHEEIGLLNHYSLFPYFDD